MKPLPLITTPQVIVASLTCILLFFGTNTYSQNYPLSKDPNKCFAQAEFPNYTLEEQRVVLQKAYTKEEFQPAVIDTVTQQFLIFDKSLNWKDYKADYVKVTQKIPIRAAVYTVNEEYEMIPDIKVTQVGFRGWHVKSNDNCNFQEDECDETTIQWLERPSQLDTSAYDDMSFMYFKQTQKPQYRTITYIKPKPLTLYTKDDLPGKYQSFTYPVLVKPARKIKYHYPTLYGTKIVKQPFQKGKNMKWVNVLCPKLIKGLVVQQVLLSLQQRKYYVGSLSEEWTEVAQKGLIKFQRDNHLPIGHFDQETVEALGLNFEMLLSAL